VFTICFVILQVTWKNYISKGTKGQIWLCRENYFWHFWTWCAFSGFSSENVFQRIARDYYTIFLLSGIYEHCFEFPRSESSSKSVFKNKDNSSKNMTTNAIGYTTTPHYSRRSNDLSKYKTHKITSRNAESQSKSKSSAMCSVL